MALQYDLVQFKATRLFCHRYRTHLTLSVHTVGSTAGGATWALLDTAVSAFTISYIACWAPAHPASNTYKHTTKTHINIRLPQILGNLDHPRNLGHNKKIC